AKKAEWRCSHAHDNPCPTFVCGYRRRDRRSRMSPALRSGRIRVALRRAAAKAEHSCPGVLLDGYAPERARITRIGARCRVQRRQIVPQDHVADIVGIAEAILVLQRMRLQPVEKRDAVLARHAIDGKRTARHRVEGLAPGAVMRANELVADPAHLVLLLR